MQAVYESIGVAKTRVARMKREIGTSIFGPYVGRKMPTAKTHLEPPTEEDAAKWIPPGFILHLVVDPGGHCKSWQICFDGTSRSRAWYKYGWLMALYMIARFSWFRAMLKEGFDPMDCPIDGLFPVRTGNTVKDEKELAAIKIML